MYVQALPHLKSDVLTLLILLETPEPPVHLIRSKKMWPCMALVMQRQWYLILSWPLGSG